MGWIAWIIVGVVAGFLAEQIMKADMGLLMNLGLGIVGAVVGGFLLGLIGLDDSGNNMIYSIIVATFGAVVVLWIANKVKGRS